jgi:hypothetical protein
MSISFYPWSVYFRWGSYASWDAAWTPDKEKDTMVLKLDFKKAYDKIKWPFLQQALRIKGFSPMWCEWIHKVMSKGSVALKVNDVVGRYFQTCKGVHQVDHLSSILFNLAMNVFAKLIDRAKVNGQIKGIVPHLVDDGLSRL